MGNDIFEDKAELERELEEEQLKDSAMTAFGTGKDAAEFGIDAGLFEPRPKEKKKLGDKSGLDNVKRLFK